MNFLSINPWSRSGIRILIHLVPGPDKRIRIRNTLDPTIQISTVYHSTVYLFHCLISQTLNRLIPTVQPPSQPTITIKPTTVYTYITHSNYPKINQNHRLNHPVKGLPIESYRPIKAFINSPSNPIV